MSNKIFNIDFNLGNVLDADGGILMTTPTISYQAAPNWELHFVENVESAGSLVPIDVSQAVSWNAAVDVDFTDETQPMIRTLPSAIITSGAASGIIVVPLDANTETFYQKINGRNSIPAYFEIRGRDSNDRVIYDYRFRINALGAIDPQGGEPLPVVSGGVTMADVYALLRSATQYQFSDNGVEWHYPQREGDIYYQSRYPEGAWSDAIELVKGTDGADGYNVKFEYSADNSSWHPTPASSDFYFRNSNDNGSSWTTGILFRGSDGANGIGFELLGEYNAETTYNPPSLGNYECVYYDGSTYAYINSSASSGHTPPATSDSYWMKIAAQGSVENITVSDITDFDSVMAGLLSGFATKGEVYTTSQMNTLLAVKANAEDVYSRDEANAHFVDTEELAAVRGGLVEIQQWSDQNTIFQNEIDYLSGQISGGGGDLSNYYTKSEVNNISAYLQNEIDNIPSGGGGGSVITGGISGFSQNGVYQKPNNGNVNIMALPMATTMPSSDFTQEFMLYLGNNVNGDTYKGAISTIDINEGPAATPSAKISGQFNLYQEGGPDVSGTQRYWDAQGPYDLEAFRITYESNTWKLKYAYTGGDQIGPGTSWTDRGSLTTPYTSGQPWGLYTVDLYSDVTNPTSVTSSTTWNIYPISGFCAAQKGHLYERSGQWDDKQLDIACDVPAESDPQEYTLTKVTSQSYPNGYWSSDGRDQHGNDDTYQSLEWSVGTWNLHIQKHIDDDYVKIDYEYDFHSPECPATTPSWAFSGLPVWSLTSDGTPYDDGLVVTINQKGWAGGWMDIGSMLH